MPSTRREFVRDVTVTGSALLLGCSRGAAAGSPPPLPPLPGATRVRTLPFLGGRGRLEELYGTGWSGRFRQDLKLLSPSTLITPNQRFYIRTRAPKGLPTSRGWKVALRDRGKDVDALSVANLVRRSKPMGVHLMECSGNGGQFGLLSAAEWDGVPLVDVLDEAGLSDRSALVHVDGYDVHPELRKRGEGCSWVFKREEIEATGAFLATKMNGVPLPLDHGYPVRLLNPGWYGCTCVKWVQTVELVADDFESTPQMREYDTRTHQDGTPRLARDYRPAKIDTAAMPVRVEEWDRDGEAVYRIVGIVWGGERTVESILIHCGAEPPVPVDDFEHQTHRTWNLWTHEWRPAERGRIELRCSVPDDTVRTRRLDSGWYTRAVEIS